MLTVRIDLDRTPAREKNREEHDRLRSRLFPASIYPCYFRSLTSCPIVATQEATERRRFSSRSSEAFQSGDRALAKQLSDEGKKHDKKMRKYNRLARDCIFDSQNPPDQALGLIDLHGLRVKEAEKLLLKRMSKAKAEGVERLVVIVGKGNHSINGVPKIKPAVEGVCRDRDLICIPSYFNEGRVEILLKDYHPEIGDALDTSDSEIDLSGAHSSYNPFPWSTPPARHQAYYAHYQPSLQYDYTNYASPQYSLESARAYTRPQPSPGYIYGDSNREEEKSNWKFLSKVGAYALLLFILAVSTESPILSCIMLVFWCLYFRGTGERS